MKTGLIDVVEHTAPWIILGLSVAALADAILLTNALNSIPDWSEVALFTLLAFSPTFVPPVQLPWPPCWCIRAFRLELRSPFC